MSNISTTTKWFSGPNKDRDLEAFLNKQNQNGRTLVAFAIENARGLYRFVFAERVAAAEPPPKPAQRPEIPPPAGPSIVGESSETKKPGS